MDRPLLPADVEALWAEYLEAERDRIRGLTMDRLQRFVCRLLQEDSSLWQAWALHLASSIADEGNDLPVRFPLLRSVLLPAMAAGIASGKPGCARWLSHLDYLLYHCDLSVLPEHLRTPVGLLQEAIRVDPDDTVARSRLIERHASYMDYTLHEIPAGVLYGYDGATEEQCSELLEQLAEFRNHVEVLGQSQKYAELIGECNLHYNAYREYLVGGRQGSYEQFLESRGTKS